MNLLLLKYVLCTSRDSVPVGWKRTLVDKTVYQIQSIDTSQKRKKKMAPHRWLDKDLLIFLYYIECWFLMFNSLLLSSLSPVFFR
jgi:hypothetical protein